MPSKQRIERLSRLILRRAGEVVTQELKDPRLGLVTISRVKLAEDLKTAQIFWSVYGDETERSRSAHALDHARGHVQSEIASIMHTRVTPVISFHYDESIEGAIRVTRIIDELTREREALESDDEGEAHEDEPASE